jgi:hypothetical protein
MDGSGAYPVRRDNERCVRADGSHRKGGEMEIKRPGELNDIEEARAGRSHHVFELHDLCPEDYEFQMQVTPFGYFIGYVEKQTKTEKIKSSLWLLFRHPRIWLARYKAQRAANKISKALSRFLED